MDLKDQEETSNAEGEPGLCQYTTDILKYTGIYSELYSDLINLKMLLSNKYVRLLRIMKFSVEWQ